jgi:hypothetical protein
MKNTEKLNAKMNGPVQPRFNGNVPFRAGLVSFILPFILSACATEAEFLAENAPSAQNTALTRGRFELNCPQATATVLSQKVTYINGIAAGGYEWTEYTIGVRGCDKQTVYMVACRDRNNCNAFSQTANVLESTR